MEIFIFKFPYIANYEIISVGLTVISFCFSFECRGVARRILPINSHPMNSLVRGEGSKYRQASFVQVHLAANTGVCAQFSFGSLQGSD